MLKLTRALNYLWPGEAEQDEGFRQEILALSHASLRAIGAQEVILPLLMLLLRFAAFSDSDENGSARELLALAGVGAVTSAVAKTAWSRRHARVLAALSAWLVTAILIRSSGAHLMAARVFGPDHYVPGYVTIVMLVAVASIPLRPLQTLGLGLSIESFYFLSFLETRRSMTPLDAFQHSFVLLLVLLCTVLTVNIYLKRHCNYLSHQQAVAASRRALLAESAASMGRFAATLSHELNSPLGALTSSIDSLGTLAAKRTGSVPAQQQDLESLENSLCQTAMESARRLRQVIDRMQRFTNLDRAEVRPTDLNGLLQDVAGVLDLRGKAKTLFEFDLQPLPPVHCHAQQVSAVFYALLSNAVNAIEGDGRIGISTRKTDSHIEVRIEHNAPGMPARSGPTTFDPGFEDSGGRIAGGNWSLFHSRQIVREHGGEILIESAAGRGAIASVTFPLSAPSENAANSRARRTAAVNRKSQGGD